MTISRERLGVAVIGAGVVGRMRAQTVSLHPDTDLLVVADADEKRAGAAVHGTRATPVIDNRRALDTPGVDAVIVSTPGHLHEALVMEALQAGKHVLCEKPLGIDVRSCQRMLDAAAASGRTLAVGFNHRYFPCVKVLKDVLDAGRIGVIDHVRAMAGHPGLHEFRADWMYQREMSGGGAMMDIGIHMTDLVQFVAGDIADVRGITSNRVWSVPGSEDNALAVMTTVRGIPVSYQATWSEWKGYRLALEVYGATGMVGAYYAPMMNVTVITDQGRAHRTRTFNLHAWVNLREKLRGWQTTATIAFAEELTDFLHMIAGRPTRIASGAAGLRAVAIARAVEESSASGGPVCVKG